MRVDPGTVIERNSSGSIFARAAFYDRTHFHKRSDSEGGESFGDRDCFIEAGALDRLQSAENLLGFGKRSVRDDHFALPLTQRSRG